MRILYMGQGGMDSEKVETLHIVKKPGGKKKELGNYLKRFLPKKLKIFLKVAFISFYRIP